MQINALFKVNLTATTFVMLLFNTMPSLAFTFSNPRSLKSNELLADQSIFQLKTPWNLSSNLNGEDSFTTTFSFPDGIPFNTDPTRNVTGSRKFLSPDATSYELQFNGQYEDAPSLLQARNSWGTQNLFDDSFGKITSDWGQKPGWKTLTGANAKFTQIWDLTKQYLSPGELNCPTVFDGKQVIGCPVVETWWGGAVDVKAGGSLSGSISNNVIGTELVSLTLQLDRVLDYKIDSSSDRIASILNDVQALKLTDANSGLGDVNIKFNATVNGKQTQVQVNGDTVWRQAGSDIETADPSYQLQVGTDKLLIQGVRSEYTEMLVDFPTMRLGIELENGTGANASAFMGAFNPLSERQAVIQVETVPVPEPCTILGSATVIGFGALLKRKLSKKQKQMPKLS